MAVACGSSVLAQAPSFSSEHRMWPFGGAPLTSHLDGGVAFGDVDGDGDLDAVVAGNGVELYRNEGLARFVRITNLLSASAYSEWSSAALGDVDGDGDLDALIGSGRFFNCWQNQDVLLVNDGTGHFGSAVVWPALGDCTRDARFVDLDGDGALDVVLANYNGDPCRVLSNNGSGQFTNVPIPSITGFNAVVPSDFDGDGDQDLLFAGATSSKWLENLSQFTFQVASVSVPAGKCAAFGDLDGDGDDDLVLGNANLMTLLVRTTGPAQFQAVGGAFPPVSGTAHSVCVGDVDADNDLDVVVGMEDGAGVLLLNNGAGAFTLATPAAFPPIAPSGVAKLDDLDGDGDLDVVLARGLLLNDGSGTFVDVTGTSPQAATHVTDVVSADFNGDGEVDVAIAQFSFDGMKLYMGEGAGVFREASVPAPPAAYVGTSIGAGDLDNDGDVDIVLGMEWPNHPNLVFWNNGTGQFAVTNPPGFGSEASDVDIADFDHDGDLDVLLAAFGNQNLSRLLINTGTGSFVNSQSWLPPIPVNGHRDFAVGDLDNDGDLDIWGSRNSECTVWSNDGAAHFSDVPGATAFSFDSNMQGILGDFDGDGDVDSIEYVHPTTLRLYQNDGSGHFTTAAFALPQVDAPAEFACADFDNDGDLDVCAAAFGLPRKILHNDGTGHFTSEVLDSLPNFQSTSALTVADFDKDRDLDVFDGGSGLWKNMRRDLSWRATPRIGYPLTIDVHGAPNAPFRLAASTAALDSPLWPYGLLRIDTQSIRFVSTGMLDANGAGSVSLVVPNDPILIGRTYYWQALVGTPMRLTGFEKTTFTGL